MGPLRILALLVIPLALAVELNSLASGARVNGVFNNQTTMAKLVQAENIERKNVVMPLFAVCMPEKQVVQLERPPAPNVMYFPSCTRIERCSGCCQHELLSCQPVETELINYQLHVLTYSGGESFGLTGTKIVTVEKHKKCRCECKEKPEHCTPLQIYNETECKCSCRNTDEYKKCLDSDHNTKYWDPTTCSCQCIKPDQCNTGFSFNKHTCSCEPELRPRIRYGQSYTNTRLNPTRRDEYTFV